MAGNQRQVINGHDWMRNVEKRMAHEERRPRITSAQELLGPGFSPYAVETQDWNADELTFNGFWYSTPGALHSPDPTNSKYYMGYTEGNGDGWGIQYADEYRPLAGDDMAWAPQQWMRRFYPPAAGGQRAYSAWCLTDEAAGGLNMKNLGVWTTQVNGTYSNAVQNVGTIAIPERHWVTGRRFRVTWSGQVVSDTAGAYTELYLRYGTNANLGVGTQQCGAGLLDNRVAGRRETLMVQAETPAWPLPGFTSGTPYNVVAVLNSSSGSTQSRIYAASDSPIWMSLDVIF